MSGFIVSADICAVQKLTLLYIVMNKILMMFFSPHFIVHENNPVLKHFILGAGLFY
ncbi:hypothetical protein KP77_23790 [Jeotgalibacillus alimentarius]|uniref:Uncharacterized protein n=1 Tax=Jeotgalibacillus alimentarius TaxID=135826 RepID=A0A0C2RZN2_9BACL|nr:hypothetical protein KP77_23790 [Jeotgalibacillus alimentarius]